MEKLDSPLCFIPVLSSSQYSIWLVFVEACSLVCSRVISKNAINRADLLIHHYCCLFEDGFGKENCYFGPASSFWLFGFERMNGVLDSVRTSNVAVEVQLFRKFISKQQDIELTHMLKPVTDQLDVTKDNTHCGGWFIHIINPFEQASG